MAKPRNKLVDYVVYIAARLAAMFVHMFPIEACYRAVGALSGLAWRLDRRHRELALAHLRASFPDWPEGRIQSVGRASLHSVACLGLEALFTTRLIAPSRWRRHVVLANQAEVIRMLLENRSGVIFVAGHFGNFEVVGYTMATLGFASVAVARPIDNPYVNDWINSIREKTGLSLLYKKGATQSMDDILQAKGSLSFIADQDAGRKGIFVDFFGRPASTFRTPALMAMRHNVPIVVGYGKRLDEHYRFELGVEEIISPADWADKDDPLRWITQQYTSALERVVRRTPEQYWWVHRRWKHQPA